MYNYTIFENYGEKVLYRGTSLYRVLEFRDNRQRDRYFPKSYGIHFLTEDIHYTFFKQLTEQISLKIVQTIKIEFSKESFIALSGRYFLDFGSFFCLHIWLSWGKHQGEYVWVKCNKSLSSFNLFDENDVIFELCDKEESCSFDIQLYGHASNRYWVEEFQNDFEVNRYKKRRTSSISSYPDIVLKCKSRRKINGEQRTEIYNKVKSFITEWNELKEFDLINYFDLLESDLTREVSFHIDFGNCEPIALEKLYYVLLELDFINKVELG